MENTLVGKDEDDVTPSSTSNERTKTMSVNEQAASFVNSALASVSQMASKSILNSFSSSSNSASLDSEAEKPGEYESVLSRALSLRKRIPTFNRENTTTATATPTDTSTNNSTNTNSNTIGAESPKEKTLSFTDSITAAAESTLTNFINQLDRNLTLSSENSESNVSQQKQKHNIFAKLESQSLSISKALFGTASLNIDDDCEVFASTSPNQQAANFNLDDNESSLLDDRMISSKNNSTADSLPESTPHTSGSMSTNGSFKRKTKPSGTLEYTVEPGETLEKIALKWNAVPSEILHLNRLVTRVIFPGQVLFVPDPNYVPPPPAPPAPPQEGPKAQLSIEIINEINELNCSGEEHGDETKKDHHQNTFGIFGKWKSGAPGAKPGHVEKQKQKSHSQSDAMSGTRANANDKRGTFTSRHTLTEEEARRLDEECMQRFLKIKCKIVTRTKGCFEGVLIITPSALMFDPLESNSDTFLASGQTSDGNGNEESTSSNHDSHHNHGHPRHESLGRVYASSIYDEASALIPIEIISNVIMYEDLSLKDVREYFEYQNHLELCESEDGSEHPKRTSEISFGLHEVAETTGNSSDLEASTEIKLPAEKVDLSSSLSEVEPSEEQKSKKKNSLESELEVSSAKSDVISCYLCIKVNKNKDIINCPINRKMKNRLSSEFWFQINDQSYKTTDKICAFFLEWKSDPTFAVSSDSMPKGQFRLIKQHEKLTDLISGELVTTNSSMKTVQSTNRLINKTSFVKDWEIVNLKEYEHKLKKEIEIESEYKTLPNLIGESTMLKEDNLRKLNVNLIPRAVGYNWILTFSTELHGFSLNTMYRLLADVDSPCLVVVMDINRNIFGAMSPCKLIQSEHYYGTGESFLFTFYPSFRIFKWTGENNFFIRGTPESLGFGCAEGYHGLWFDSDLLNGHTQRSKTYDNDMLTSNEYFTIAAIEVWTFSD